MGPAGWWLRCRIEAGTRFGNHATWFGGGAETATNGIHLARVDAVRRRGHSLPYLLGGNVVAGGVECVDEDAPGPSQAALVLGLIAECYRASRMTNRIVK